MKDLFKQLIEAGLLLAVIFILTGCATVEGIGKDLQAGSQAGRQYLVNQ